MNIQGGDYTNTYCIFNFFMNTREYKCLAYGPGLLEEGTIGQPTEFIIQARNDHDENRTSGRDNFQVKVTQTGDAPKEIPSELVDNDDGTYHISYQVDEPAEVKIDITFENAKGKMIPIRGSPYHASFIEKGHSNLITGPAMQKHVTSSLEQINTFIQDTNKGIALKDKDVENDVKQLINVKDLVEEVFSRNDEMIFWLDCVDETLKLFQSKGIAKDSQLKTIRKQFDLWKNLKKNSKEVKKEITPFVENETEKTKQMIRKLEDDLKTYNSDLKKREFYYYKTGPDAAIEKLGGVGSEITDFEERIEDLGYNCGKFGKPDLIQQSIDSVKNIKSEIDVMNILWDHIKL
jgi:hypothetical protein